MSPETQIREKPLSRYAKVVGLTFLAGMVAGGVAGLVSVLAPEGGWLGAMLTAAAVSVAMGFGLWISLGWWQGLDEAAQEAHKWAWWWGATVGMAVAGVVILTLIYGVGNLGQAPIQDMLLVGASIVGGFQLLGYGVAWGIWWMKRR